MKTIKRIIKTILLLVVIIFVSVIIISKLSMDKITKEQDNIEIKYEGTKEKVLILHQDSLLGLTKKVYKYTLNIFKNHDCNITSNHPRKDNNYNINDYDVIVLISPVYVGKIAAPIEEFCEGNDFSNKKVFILLTGNIDDTKEIEELKLKINNPLEIVSLKVKGTNSLINQKINELLD